MQIVNDGLSELTWPGFDTNNFNGLHPAQYFWSNCQVKWLSFFSFVRIKKIVNRTWPIFIDAV